MAGNPYKLLLSTLPDSPQQVGTVQTVQGDGTSNVLLVGGGTVNVAGDGFNIGATVFVKEGRILSEAPSLNIQLVEV